jgi:hypothetical protein
VFDGALGFMVSKVVSYGEFHGVHGLVEYSEVMGAESSMVCVDCRKAVREM